MFDQVAINFGARSVHPDDNSIDVLHGPKLFKYYEDNFDQQTFAKGRKFIILMPKRHFGSWNFKTQSIQRSALRSIL